MPEKTLVGNGGFTGPPNDAGCVEIGYEVAPEYWGRGFATAAIMAMLRRAFGYAGVQAVEAHTLAEINASNRVLQKVGMAFVEEIPNPEVGVVWRWRIAKEQYKLD